MPNWLPFARRAVVFLALLVSCAIAQDNPVESGSSTLAAPPVTPEDVNETLQGMQAPFTYRPNGCLQFSYYNKTAGTVSVQDSTPTQKWAVRMNLTSLNQMVSLCTLWTVETNFRWVPKTPGPGDTLHIFMREVYPPYHEFYHVKYLVRLGENRGGIELDPPLPGNPRPHFGQPRDVFLGMYITGGYGNQVTWRMKTPPQYNNTFIFVNPQNPVPATPAGVFGIAGDLEFSALWCFYWVPVELSLFSGYADNANVHLEWRTQSETDSYRFDIQRRAGESGEWETRGSITSAGTTRKEQRYSFTDPLGGRSAETFWYRLRQMDFDGTYEYFGPIRIQSSIPAMGFALREAYPNPVTETGGTSIGYELPADAAVNLTVYDALGRSVAELVHGSMPAGSHECRWFPAAALPNGTYYVVMRTPQSLQTRKVSIFR